MKSRALRTDGMPAFDLIEEAFVLLRTCPPAIIAWYLAASVPFAAGLMIFCSEMAGNPDAAPLLPAASAALAVLYFWMTWGQARFSAALLTHLRGSPAERWGVRRNLSLAARQAILQSTALIAIPLSSLTLAALGFVCAFYQTASALDDGRRSTRELFQAGISQSILWPAQCFGVFSLLSAFSLVIFINWMTLIAAAPVLLEMITGIETVFTRSPWSMINSTFFAAVLVLSFLTLEPLARACTVLRCFYGESIATGDDIRARLRSSGVRAATLLAAVWLALSAPGTLAAEPAPASAEHLEASIREVIQHDKYRWRQAPDTPEKRPDDTKRWEEKFRAWLKEFRDKVRRAWESFLKWLNPDHSSSTGTGGLASMTNQLLLYALLIVAAGLLAFVTVRIVQARRKTSLPLFAAQADSSPDLNRDDTAPDALPEDEWTRLGRKLMEEGNPRLALRAFYLASLAHLAGRGLVTITRGKSNREYERELGRRGRSLPDLALLFGENVGTFERIWYGLHEADSNLVRGFLANVEQMKAKA